jgi:hypothetical protein
MGRDARRRQARKKSRSDYQPDVSEISRARVAKLLRADIAGWLKDPAAGPPGSFMAGDPAADPVAMSAVLLHWLVSAREHITPQQAREAVTWLSDTLGLVEGDVVYAAGLIGHPDAPDVSFNDGVDQFGGMVSFLLYLVLLSGALVATVADGDPEWLRQFDLSG